MAEKDKALLIFDIVMVVLLVLLGLSWWVGYRMGVAHERSSHIEWRWPE
jgi:hypothetical protein